MTRKTPRISGTLYVLPTIPDDAPTEIKNGLAIRNQANVDGTCPDCGATPHLYQDALGQYHGIFQHEEGCKVYT